MLPENTPLLETERLFLRKFNEKDVAYRYAIVLKTDNHPIGYVNIDDIGEVMKKVGMTYRYSYKEMWQPKNFMVTFKMYQLNLDSIERVYTEYQNIKRGGADMEINVQLAKAYSEGRKVAEFCNEWYFTSSSIAGDKNKNIFTEPVYEEKQRENVALVCDEIQRVASNFTPTNLAIWEELFSDWKEVIMGIKVDLIVGFPEPYEATVERDPESRHHVIFDVGLWTKYIEKCNITDTVQNLLTHELCHVLIGRHIVEIDDDIESEDYLTNLDANTFHEAFAHLVSYNAAEIETVDWHTEEMESVRAACQNRMEQALLETEQEAQKQNLYDGVCGNYYEKFSCMCGMFYLVALWEQGGIPALEKCFRMGYHHFAKKTVTVKNLG